MCLIGKTQNPKNNKMIDWYFQTSNNIFQIHKNDVLKVIFHDVNFELICTCQEQIKGLVLKC